MAMANSMTGDVEVRRREGAPLITSSPRHSSPHAIDWTMTTKRSRYFFLLDARAHANMPHEYARSLALWFVQVGCHGAKRPGDAGRSRRKLMAVVLLAAGVLVLVPAAMGFTKSRFSVHVGSHRVGLAENLAYSLLTPLCGLLQHGCQRSASFVAFAGQRQIRSKQHSTAVHRG